MLWKGKFGFPCKYTKCGGVAWWSEGTSGKAFLEGQGVQAETREHVSPGEATLRSSKESATVPLPSLSHVGAVPCQRQDFSGHLEDPQALPSK